MAAMARAFTTFQASSPSAGLAERQQPPAAAAPALSLTAAHSTVGGQQRVALRLRAKWRRRAEKVQERVSVRAQAAGVDGGAKPSGRIIKGKAFVVRDNIDTDQIIPAEHLTLVPSKPEEYEKLGSLAMVGLSGEYPRYIREGEMKTQYPIMIGGANFGCGSSREHAPVALGAAGCRAVVAETYARIFFRNSVATGELYPVEAEERLCERIQTGDEVTVDMEHDLLIHHPSGQQYALKPIGEAGPVIDAGGLFEYARQTGMIAAKA